MVVTLMKAEEWTFNFSTETFLKKIIPTNHVNVSIFFEFVSDEQIRIGRHVVL